MKTKSNPLLPDPNRSLRGAKVSLETRENWRGARPVLSVYQGYLFLPAHRHNQATCHDRGQAQSVEKARQYQTLIPNSQLVVVRSDAYHIAAANPDECVANVLAFIKEAKRKA